MATGLVVLAACSRLILYGFKTTTSRTALLFEPISTPPVTHYSSFPSFNMLVISTIIWMRNALLLVRDCTGTTFICWTVVPLVSLLPGHGFVDGCIEANTRRRGVAAVATARIFSSFGCVRKTNMSIVCPPRLIVCSGLFVKGTRLENSTFHMWISAV